VAVDNTFEVGGGRDGLKTQTGIETVQGPAESDPGAAVATD